MNGSDFQFVPQLAELLNKYNDSKLNKTMFQVRDKAVVVPLRLNNTFVWNARTHPDASNYNSRRDVYAAITVLRDLFSGDSKLSKLGRTYQQAHSTWKAPEKGEFMKLYKATTDKFVPGLKKVTIKGEEVTELTN